MKSCYETNDEAKSSSKQKEKESSIDASSRESRYFSWSAYSSNCVVYGKHIFAGVSGSRLHEIIARVEKADALKQEKT